MILEKIKRGEVIENYETVHQRKDMHALICPDDLTVRDAKSKIIGVSAIAGTSPGA